MNTDDNNTAEVAQTFSKLLINIMIDNLQRYKGPEDTIKMIEYLKQTRTQLDIAYHLYFLATVNPKLDLVCSFIAMDGMIVAHVNVYTIKTHEIYIIDLLPFGGVERHYVNKNTKNF